MEKYEEVELLNNSYIDLINYVGEDGLNNKLKAEDILPIIAAPYTQILSIHTDTSKMRMIAEELVLFLRQTGCSFDKMQHDEIVSKLQTDWIPTLTLEKAEELASNLSLIDSFDSNHFAVFKESIWDFYEKKSRTEYRKVQYYSKADIFSRDKKYDFSAEKNFYSINGRRVRVWTLNTEFRSHQKMMSQDIVVIFNEFKATRNIHDFSSFKAYRKAYFEDKNASEQYENWDHYINNDNRCQAYWRFCKIVQEGDIIYLAQGSHIYGYCVITGNKVFSVKEQNLHAWECKWRKYKYPVYVSNLYARPFFTFVDNAKMNRIKDAGAGVEINIPE